jgi:hypothetical protein
VRLTGELGVHDNGYTTTLSHLKTEGLLGKLIFLRGYDQIAWQLRDYGIPECNIPGVFMTQKIPNRRTIPAFHHAQSDPSFSQSQPGSSFSQSQPGPSFHQSQLNSQAQSNPMFSPQAFIPPSLQSMGVPASPEYGPRSESPTYLDPTLVRTRLLVGSELTPGYL